MTTIDSRDVDRIDRSEMDGLVAGGQAQAWTRSLGGRIPMAAYLGRQWWVVLHGNTFYEPADDLVAAVLSRARSAFTTAEKAASAIADLAADEPEP